MLFKKYNMYKSVFDVFVLIDSFGYNRYRAMFYRYIISSNNVYR